MRILPAVMAVLPLLLPITARAADPTTPGADPDRLVCHYMMRTGTRFKSKTCRTVAQWEKMTEENRKAASEMIDRPFIFDCRKAAQC